MANSLFEEKLNSNDFVVTTEVGPPKSADISEIVHDIELLKDKGIRYSSRAKLA